ncbi:family 78 glycoside hydrolase catalytic domain [Paenibacillus oceani]|uniref:alpha-L-rhamnosidase n=1 Tax=Paenibacillus oceani TaxID=2772510 RepID=A0A927C8B0_9BACL|nr:family 78 glycoside hydrolase catalytic domain [Paenibacillus oceani]MBD2861877.1 family 78 glycoside hydrolase catalytic domain [Paenibacillus oceani]
MDKRWSAHWIMDEDFAGLKPIDVYRKQLEPSQGPKHRDDLKNRHMLARTKFVLDDSYENAVLHITADDCYKLYVNGTFVGQGPAQGNHYHYYYNRYDLAPFLHKGGNVIAVHVYYQGLICRAFNSGDYRQGLIAELDVQGRTVVKTDRTWKIETAREYASGGIVGYDTQYLEHIDNRLKLTGWREPGYDDSGWRTPAEHGSDDHRLFAQPTPTVSVYEIQPVQIVALPENPGGFLLDFGGERTGQFRMKARGAPGQTIEIRCGEELEDDGSVRYKMRCNCTYREVWTLSGSDEDELEFYDYKAFRYVEVLPEAGVQADPDSFGVIVRHYPFDEEASRFESSDPLLDRIWDICREGVKYGSQENYVDCPSREKGQYLGDNTIITHAHAYLTGDLRLFRKSLIDFALLSSRTCTGFMAVAPGHFMQEFVDYSLQWPLQLLRYTMLSGDTDFLREMLPVAERLMRYYDKYKREDGLLANVTDKPNLVDWPTNMRDGYDFPLEPVGEGCHNVVNAWYYGAMLAMNEIRQLLNEPDPESGLRSSFKNAFRQAFLNTETNLFTDAEGSLHSSLHANALPLLFRLTEERDRHAVVGLIREKRLSCGVYIAYFVLQALAAAGEHELVYELITSDDLHSWSTMVKEGATTCFEVWSKDLKRNTSLCHPWASAPIPLLIEEIAGIKPASPGWASLTFAPRVPASLDKISLQFRIPSGTVRFSYADGKAELDVPDGVRVERLS